MPHRARIQRNTSIVLTLLVLVLVGLVTREHNDLRSYKQFVYERCVDRLTYDAKANAARGSDVELYREQINIEHTNHVADPVVRQRRIDAYTRAISSKLAANAATPVASCERLRP